MKRKDKQLNNELVAKSKPVLIIYLWGLVFMFCFADTSNWGQIVSPWSISYDLNFSNCAYIFIDLNYVKKKKISILFYTVIICVGMLWTIFIFFALCFLHL